MLRPNPAAPGGDPSGFPRSADSPVCRPRRRPAIPAVTPPPPGSPRVAAAALFCAAVLSLASAGCGKTTAREATSQLLTADSIDRSIAQLDLSPFDGKSVYLETEYLEHKKLDGVGVGGQNYLIGSLRQALMAAGARLEAKEASAEYVVEARAGAVGSDAHEVIYGMPENTLLSAASSVVPNAPPLPSIPEISIAKQSQTHAATKLRLFAYHRQSRRIVWQSGNAEADSQASHTWLLGAGPFEKGDIYDGTRFAGDKLRVVPKWLRRKDPHAYDPKAALADYNEPRLFPAEHGLLTEPPAAPPSPLPEVGAARLASAEEPAEPAREPAPEEEKDEADDGDDLPAE